ncbi:MAG: putative tellurite resistance protein B-like protein [Myxococcota bacterium]|jgi:uncharacterized tellurite resistance protein B-like protein
MSETITFKARNNREVEVSAKLWNEAVARTEKKGDGRLGEEDARALFALVAADNSYSELEKKSIKHIRAHFRWTAKGNATFRTLIREAAGKNWDSSEVETTTFKATNGRDVAVVASLWGEAQALTESKGDGRLGHDDANALFELVSGDGEYSDLEKKTIKHIRKNFKWTDKGNDTFRSLIRATAGSKGWTDKDVEAALSDAE